MSSSHISPHRAAVHAISAGTPALERLPGLALILAAALGTILIDYVGSRIPWNSDMAMVGLTARDIERAGTHPVFFEGSDYAGTLEQHWVALWFRLFGDSVLVHRMAIGALLLGIVALVWLLARLAFGPPAGFWAGAYVALGPPFFFYRGLTSEGPYAPIYLIGAGILCTLVAAERRAHAERSIAPQVIIVGFLGGLGWWTHPLALVWGSCALIAAVAGRVRRALRWQHVCGAILAFILGSLPWSLRNIESGWRSLRGPDAGHATLSAVRTQGVRLFDTALPVLLGTRPMWADRPSFPGGAIAAWLLLAVVVTFGVRLALRREDSVERFGARLLVPLVLLCPAFALLSHRTNFVEPRLIYPYYFTIAPLVGAALAGGRLRGARAGAAALLLALHGSAHMLAPRFPGPPTRLVSALRERGVRAFYGSYWDVYTIDFLADGIVIGTPFGPSAATRREPEAAFVDGYPAPAFLLSGDDARRMLGFLKATNSPATVETIEGRLLVRGLPSEFVAPLRGCLCVPDSRRGP